jgi:hypothetical protein
MARVEGWQVFALNWRESERGMGQRDDGFSLHLSVEDAEAFRKEFDRQGSPDLYSFADWLTLMVIVNDGIYDELVALKNNGRMGLRRYNPVRVKAGQYLDLR